MSLLSSSESTSTELLPEGVSPPFTELLSKEAGSLSAESLPEDLIYQKGEEILENMGGKVLDIFQKSWWMHRAMDWSMKDEAFKVQLFRLVDVLPMLHSPQELSSHLKEYLKTSPFPLNWLVHLGPLAPRLTAYLVQKHVLRMAELFIAGQNMQEAAAHLRSHHMQGLGFTVDLLGEKTLSEQEAQGYVSSYLKLIDDLSQEVKNWPSLASEEQVSDCTSVLRANISVKLSSIYSQIHVWAWEESKEVLKVRLRVIFRRALEKEVFVYLDMEHYELKDLTLAVFLELLQEAEFANSPHFGIVLQAYLRDSLMDAQKLVQVAHERGVPFTVRLVKGAYWDYETIVARQRGWPVPVFSQKWETDHNYEACWGYLMRHYPHIRTTLASHNVRTIASGLVQAQQAGVPLSAIEVKVLYGMGGSLKQALLHMGVRVREYVPVGELIPGMAYLVRRLLENTSNESFLGHFQSLSLKQALAPPAGAAPSSLDSAESS